MCGFLYIVSNNHTSILHSYGDSEPQRYCGSDLDNLGHVTSLLTWPFDWPCALSSWRSVITMYQSWTVIEIWSPKDIQVMFLTYRGHVTSSVTWPFDSQCGASNRLSTVTIRLSGAVIEIFSLEDIACPCHVTCRQGVKNDHIFGIPVAILPMHYTTFMGLRWRLRGISRWKFYTGAILSKIFQAQFSAQISTLGNFSGVKYKFRIFNPQKAHPFVRQRRLRHRARKSAEGSDL